MFVAGQAIRVRTLPALLIVAVAMLSRPALLPAANASVLPERPRVILDTTYVPPTGRTLAVPAGGDLQAALNAAVGGDVITLQAGATFSGPFTLPNKSGTGWIIVRTSAADSTLPPPGTRITGAYAGPALPKIVVGAGVGGALRTASGAHHFRFIGIEFAPTPGAFVYSLIELGAGETSAAALPHDLIFDRCFIHGDPTVGGRRGIAMNSASTAVIDSALWGFTEVGADAQAIASWSGTGPFKIVNNYLEASGENVMFGGDGPSILNLVPADIEVRGNYFFKPLTWKVGDPSYAGVAWTVKNLFELKNAQRVLLDGNIFEHNWVGADQHGAAVLFTVRNQTGSSPWAIVADATFTHNIVRHATGGIEILGRAYLFLSQQAQRLLIQNNLFHDIAGAQWAGPDRTGRPLQPLQNHRHRRPGPRRRYRRPDRGHGQRPQRRLECDALPCCHPPDHHRLWIRLSRRLGRSLLHRDQHRRRRPHRHRRERHSLQHRLRRRVHPLPRDQPNCRRPLQSSRRRQFRQHRPLQLQRQYRCAFRHRLRRRRRRYHPAGHLLGHGLFPDLNHCHHHLDHQ